MRQRHLVANPAASARARRTAQARIAKRDEYAENQNTPALPSVEVAELAPLDVLCLRHDGPVATQVAELRNDLRHRGRHDGRFDRDHRHRRHHGGDHERA